MKQLDNLLERHFRLLYALLILAALGMYAVFSLESLIWADEAYTFALIGHSFPEIWRITAADVHPPLYYFLLKVLVAPFGANLFVSRLVSALPCVMVAAVGGWQFRKLFSTRTALLFMVLYLAFPFSMTAATEVRMYALAELCVFLNALYAYRCWKWNRPADWAVFALAGTCAAYTHYFALVSAGIVYGLLMLFAFRKKELWKGWLLASGATILLFLPWLGSFISQLVYKVENAYWIEPITISTLIGYVTTVFGSANMRTFPLFFLLAYLAAFGALLFSRNRERITLLLCALAVPAATVLVGVAASILVRPVFVIRYLLPAIPLVIFAFSLALGSLSCEMLFSSLVTVCLIAGVNNALFTVSGAISNEPDRITPAMVSSLPEHEACVVLSGNTLHASQAFAHYDNQHPVYTVDPIGADNPYPNRFSHDGFLPENNPHILLILETGGEIPAEYLSVYSAELLSTVSVSGTGHDLWYLTAE